MNKLITEKYCYKVTVMMRYFLINGGRWSDMEWGIVKRGKGLNNHHERKVEFFLFNFMFFIKGIHLFFIFL